MRRAAFLVYIVVAFSACRGAVLETAAAASGSGGAQAGPLAAPPPPGPPRAPDGAGPRTFAVTKLHIGDADPDGTPDRLGGWRHYGYNIDGLDWSTSGALRCQAVAGAPPTVFAQGIDGIENSYGRNLLPIVLGVMPDAGARIDATITSGTVTLLLSLDGLGAGPSDNPLPSRFALGGNVMAAPKLDGSDAWPVQQGSTASFASAYVVDDTWVSAPSGSIEVPFYLLFAGDDWPKIQGVKVPIAHAVLSMKLDATHEHATGGILSGVIPTETLVAAMRAVQSTESSFCAGPVTDILEELRQASDILEDGRQDPTKVCDGISIGVGFDAVLVQPGPTVPPPPPPPSPCVYDGG